MESMQIKKREISAFDFLKGKLTQTKALNCLETKTRYNGKLYNLYELIESLPSGLSAQQKQVASHKSLKGYVLKWVIGSMICNYKAEADYYLYLQKGGRKYSDFLAELKEIEIHNQEVNLKIRQAKEEKEIREYKENKENGILLALTKNLEEYTDLYVGKARQELHKYKAERQTKYIKEEIEYYEKLIAQRTLLASSNHEIINRIYRLHEDKIEKVFVYEIGCQVLLYQRDKLFITSVEETRKDRYGDTSYRLKKVGDMVNVYSGYEDLLPMNEIPYNKSCSVNI